MRVLLCFLSICFGSIVSAAPTTWPINSYKIIQRAPDATSLETVLSAAQIAHIEAYLVKVGVEYQRLGFGPPGIDTLTPNGNSFEIYGYDYPAKDENGANNAPARYGPICEFRRPNKLVEYTVVPHDQAPRFIKFDTSRTLKNASKLTDKMYEDLAHELFHAIAAGTKLFIQARKDRLCKLGDWISEGTADALGIYMGNKFAGISPLVTRGTPKTTEEFSRIITLTGIRDYSFPLTKPKTNPDAYYTSSFWRYIGEYFANGNTFATRPTYLPAEGQTRKSADYRYLVDFFDETIVSEKREDELRWLDKQLAKKETKLKFSELYSNFVTSYSHYIPHRQDADGEGFRKRVFGAAEVLTLSAENPEVHTKNMTFRGVSARQVIVEYTGKAPVTMAVRLDGTQDKIEIIKHIGMLRAHGINTSTGLQATVNPPSLEVLRGTPNTKTYSKSFREWTFNNLDFSREVKGSKKNRITFIISSAADDISKTPTSANMTFRVSIPGHDGTISWSE